MGHKIIKAKVDVDYSDRIDSAHTLGGLKKILDRLLARPEFDEDTVIEFDVDEEQCLETKYFIKRFENDKEYQERIESEKALDSYRRKQYEMLKKEFEGE